MSMDLHKKWRSPEASTQIIVFKYFTDFIRLHATLKNLHQNLFPSKDKEFPVLPKGGMHCHSNLSIMEEQRIQSLLLLEYSAQIPELYNSDIFTSFTMTHSANNYVSDLPTHNYFKVDEPFLFLKAKSENVTESTLNPNESNNSISTSPSIEESILLAETLEKKQEIHQSVSHYKLAIKKLLDKAKSLKDDNPLASRGLSKKASEYLRKVESLIKKRDKSWDKNVEKMENVSKDLCSSNNIPYSDLFGDVKDLNRYKVTGILEGKNIEATDTRRGNMKVVLKTLQKSSLVFKCGKTSLLPINIRFMVKLICYYETEDFIYLVLENVCHGKIYDLVDYIFSVPYTILESNSRKITLQVNGHFYDASEDVQNISDDELTRVEIRDDGLFCFDKDGIEDISFKNELEEAEYSQIDPIEMGEEVLGPHFLNYRDMSFDTRNYPRDSLKTKETQNEENSSNNLYEFFPNVAQKESFLPLSLIRKWAFQICQVLFGLHARNIIIKDLNPENLLLDESCNVKLTYQCQWVSVDKPLSSEAMEGGYVAPELNFVEPLTPTCDWWSVGIMLFELSSGVRFCDMYPSGLLSHTPIQYPNQIYHLIDEDLKDFVEQLLQPIPHLRLGAGSEGPASIKSHPFLKMFDLKNEL
ncbi:uncharacterized protein [Lepeophtheirus salmonis]|uniref:uncharacterized protein isoform X2 n=1 Tax=Lepeophtheirus salmonis TaxID=72036 RepID=UPI001AE561F6|nr:ribosomal protein S6 kinase delta-1-like isoform X2 [Lepeophtheirus salmonis]XP_040578767.1 ribosomal protein S6 kinase delta-1-like isoform X2 [Lepeophtheirus salmonis]